MNGAETLVATLVDAGVSVCFANPGTSEMHFVRALDANPGIRCVLCLFEGVVSGAADGYARMTGAPAATLLHLGPGLANAGANLHNAMRASSPILNIVGDHATYHRHLDAPLTSDIEALARVWSTWVKTARTSTAVAGDAAEAIMRAREGAGGIATLILPADTAWNEAQEPAPVRLAPSRAAPEAVRVAAIAELLRRGKPTLLLLGNNCLGDAAALENADRIAQATGAAILAETSYARLESGAGRVAIETVPYPVDEAVARLAPFEHCILVGAVEPVGFFAYPDKPGKLLPRHCRSHVLAHPHEDAGQALLQLASALDADSLPPRLVPTAARERAIRDGRLTGAAIGASLANRMPEMAVVCDEGLTAGVPISAALTDAAPHTRLQLTGGAIGIGLPLAVGAAVACPDRKVVVLQADGSGMYTVQAMWTHARENLDILTIVLSNRAYALLRYELKNVGIEHAGPKALAMTSLQNPELDWTALARGMGVPSECAGTAEAFDAILQKAFDRRGPFLIEADLSHEC